VAALTGGNARHRAMAFALPTIFFSVDLYSYIKLGVSPPGRLYGVVGMGLLGLGVHAMEPVIFTADKEDESDKSKKK